MLFVRLIFVFFSFVMLSACTKISPSLFFEQIESPSTALPPVAAAPLGSRIYADGVRGSIQGSSPSGISGVFSARLEGTREFTSSGGYRLRIGSADYR